jgi:hypothetical protein
LTCEQATQRRQKEMEQRLRKDASTANKVIPSKELYHIRSCALALLNHTNRLPEKKKEEYQDLVIRHDNLPNKTELTNDIIQKTVDMEFTIPNPKYIPGPELVVDNMHNDDDEIAAFIRDWRVHFLETAQPRYLPKGWNVDSPFQCDNLEKLK